MIIKSIKCGQFAGIRNKDIELKPALNIIYGENESGKSTLVELLHSLFFRDCNVGNRLTADVDFRNRFLPSEPVAGIRGDHSDGEVRFQHDGSEYSLKKVWGAGKGCVLEQDGTQSRDSSAVETELKAILGYGRGVYDDVVFPSQHNGYAAIAAILDSRDNGFKADLAALVTQALSSSGGVTSDKLGKAIDAKLSELADKWDLTRDRPEKKGLKRGTGEIYKAYEAYEAAREDYEDILAAGTEYERLKELNEAAAERMNAAVKAQEEYDKIYDILKSEADTKKLKQARENELSSRTEAAKSWGVFLKQLEAAQALKEELSAAEKMELFQNARLLREQTDTLERELKALGDIDGGDLAEVKKLLSENDRLAAKLSISLAARIKKLGNADITVLSAVTGREIELCDSLDINEAVIIKIPDVMELQLSPKDIDVEEINAAISANGSRIAEICGKYGAADPSQLEENYNSCVAKRSELAEKKAGYTALMGGRSFEQLSADCGAKEANVRSTFAVKGDIRAICGTRPVDAVIGGLSAKVRGYEESYGTEEENNSVVEALKKEISDYDKKLSSLREQSGENTAVSDPDSRKAQLKAAADSAREAATAANTSYIKAKAEYENKAVNIPEAKAVLSEREAALCEKKELYRHWAHIKQVFEKLSAEVRDNPMQGISDSFKKYLGIISGGRLDITRDMDISAGAVVSSGNNIVGYDLLSEGTKDTVSLALRLAVLEHLFPEGGGFAVFDDPFTEMDESRRSQALALIERFAEKNQVIFTTCDKSYTSIVGANVITI